MKYRRQCGGLAASLETTVEIPATREAILAEVLKALDIWDGKLTADMLDIFHYGYDDRIGWDTYQVTAPYGDCRVVIGQTDGPVT